MHFSVFFSDATHLLLQELSLKVERSVRFAEASVEIQLFNSGGRDVFVTRPQKFYAQVQECLGKFGLGRGSSYRFYHIPSGQPIDARVKIQSSSEMDAFYEKHLEDGNLIKLYFIADDPSPPPSPPEKFSSPVIPKGGSWQGSEPPHNSSVDARDKKRCLVCGEKRDLQNCHVLDDHLSHLNFDGVEMDNASNLITLCHKHHKMFDEFDFTFVPVDPAVNHKFWIVVTPLHNAELGLEKVFHNAQISFPEDSTAIPPGYLFLLKQLGAYRMACPECPASSKKFKNTQAFLSHCGSKHKGLHVEVSVRSPCNCSSAARLKNVRSVFAHMTAHHMDLLVLPNKPLPWACGPVSASSSSSASS